MEKGSLLSHAKILIVDDESDVLASTQLLLRVIGYPAVVLRDPGRVLETAKRERPGLILQDLKMPGIDVRALLHALRSDPATAQTPVVFFSADPDLATTAAEFDADGFLAKPFDKLELEQLLQRMIPPASDLRPAEGDEDLSEFRGRLHEYWNVFAAVNTYVQTLLALKDLTKDQKHVVEELDRSLLRLERATNDLHSAMLSALGNVRRPPPS